MNIFKSRQLFNTWIIILINHRVERLHGIRESGWMIRDLVLFVAEEGGTR